MCKTCQVKENYKHRYDVYATHWQTSEYQNDLHILEDDEYWSLYSDGHKWSAVTPSFSFVTNDYDEVVDISELESSPSTCETLYLNNSWHLDAPMSEVYKDIKHLPETEKESVLAALKYQRQQWQQEKHNATTNVHRKDMLLRGNTWAERQAPVGAACVASS